MEARFTPVDPVGDDACRVVAPGAKTGEESQIFGNPVRDSSPRLLRQKNHVGIEPGVAAARQSAANRTGVFQMAAFSRKPLRRAKLFHLFDNEHFDWLAARQINYSGPTYVVSVRTRPSSVIMPKTIALPPGL